MPAGNGPTARKNGPNAMEHRGRYDQFKKAQQFQQPARPVVAIEPPPFRAPASFGARSLRPRFLPDERGARSLAPTAWLVRSLAFEDVPFGKQRLDENTRATLGEDFQLSASFRSIASPSDLAGAATLGLRPAQET